MILTPREEASELVDTFYQTTPNESWINEPLGEFMETYTAWGQAKQCALIAVDNILFVLEFNLDFKMERSIGYYLEVKKEIEKL